ncbi:CynX/NimT family MFS transporter [Chloroflexota bacterium]
MDKLGVNLEEESSRLDADGVEPHQTRYRWVMLALVWFLYWAFAVVSRSIAPLVTPIMQDLRISYSQMGIILGAWPLTYAAVATVGGAIIDRWGIRKSLFVGIVIIGLSAILRYFANGFVSMFLFVAVFGLGGPMISIGLPKTVAEWFKGKERGTAVGVYMTALWIGGITAYSATNSVVMPLAGYSWRLTFVYVSLLPFAAALLWWFLSRDIRPVKASGSTSIIKVFKGLISVRSVQLILTMGFLSMVVVHGFNDWLPKILETGGLPPVVAGFAASIPLFLAIPAVLVIPRLTPPRLRGRIIALATLATAMAVLIVATTSGPALIAGLVLYGVSFSLATPLLLLALMDIPEIGSRYMGSVGGMFFCVAEIGGFGGPFILGAVKDMTGGFLIGAGFLAGMSLAMSVIALLLRPEDTSYES